MQIFLNILIALGMKLLTEKFIVSIVLVLLKKLAESTKNELDDKIIAIIEEALK